MMGSVIEHPAWKGCRGDSMLVKRELQPRCAGLCMLFLKVGSGLSPSALEKTAVDGLGCASTRYRAFRASFSSTTAYLQVTSAPDHGQQEVAARAQWRFQELQHHRSPTDTARFGLEAAMIASGAHCRASFFPSDDSGYQMDPATVLLNDWRLVAPDRALCEYGFASSHATRISAVICSACRCSSRCGFRHASAMRASASLNGFPPGFKSLLEI